MSFVVRVHGQAKQDIARNALWWAENHSVDKALEWIDAVEMQLKELSESPEQWGLALENGLFAYEIRERMAGLGKRRTYRAIFSIQGDVVHVLTVQRSFQDTVAVDQFPKSL